MRSLRLLVAVPAAVVAMAGCGGDEEEAPPPAPAPEAAPAGDHEPGSPSPGDPEYAGLGTWWQKLSTDQRIASAEEFIADNPSDCAGVTARNLEEQTWIAFGYDFPEATPTDQVMLETCALIRDGA